MFHASLSSWILIVHGSILELLFANTYHRYFSLVKIFDWKNRNTVLYIINIHMLFN